MIKLQKSDIDNYEEDLITYIILDNDEPIGSLELYETDSPDLLVIEFIRIPDTLGSRIREVIRALKRIYPKVKRLKSLRISGTKEDLVTERYYDGEIGEADMMNEVKI